jgi:hypothetical protein
LGLGKIKIKMKIALLDHQNFLTSPGFITINSVELLPKALAKSSGDPML